jgi:hypothetical protein
MKNVGGPYGGAITAALFLNEFTAGVPWAHLDIAGPMESDGDNGWLNRGATAFGTRLLIDFVANFQPVSAKKSAGRKPAAKKSAAKKSVSKPARKTAARRKPAAKK